MDIKKILIIQYALIVILIVFYIFIFKGPIYEKLKQWKLVPLPETFTELYFTDHLNLPTTITAGKSQNVKFTIHNLENKTVSYNWVIYAVPDESFLVNMSSNPAVTLPVNGTASGIEGGTLPANFIPTTKVQESTQSAGTTDQTTKEPVENKILLASGQTNLFSNDLKDVEVAISMDFVYPRQKIVVELVDMDQRVHYWVTGSK